MSGNPILYVAELRRYPLRPRHSGVPGTSTVFRSRGGRLTAPRGGYTSGELWWRAPRVGYEVDITPHRLDGHWVVPPGAPGGPCTVVVTATWVVHAPVLVVVHRVCDAPAIALAHLRHEVARVAAAAGATDPDALDRAVRRALPDRIDLAEGVRVEALKIAVRRRRPGDDAALTTPEALDYLLTDPDPDARPDPDPDATPTSDARPDPDAMPADPSPPGPDPAEAWRRDRELVRAARHVLAEPAAVPAEERDAVLAEAVNRLDRLTRRIGALLPAAGHPED
jgi:hypothetical protein